MIQSANPAEPPNVAEITTLSADEKGMIEILAVAGLSSLVAYVELVACRKAVAYSDALYEWKKEATKRIRPVIVRGIVIETRDDKGSVVPTTEAMSCLPERDGSYPHTEIEGAMP